MEERCSCTKDTCCLRECNARGKCETECAYSINVRRSESDESSGTGERCFKCKYNNDNCGGEWNGNSGFNLEWCNDAGEGS